MNCPKCEVEMKEYTERERILVDYCFHGCKSIWFDNQELAILATTETNHPSVEDLKSKGKETTFGCPRCPGEMLIEVPYVEGEDLVVDICSKCSGVFLDAKELGRLQRLAEGQEPRAVRLRRAQQRMADAGFMVFGSGS